MEFILALRADKNQNFWKALMEHRYTSEQENPA